VGERRDQRPTREAELELPGELPSIGAPLALSPGPAEPPPVSVQQALAFATDGQRRNLVIATLWLCVPVLGYFALQGWACEAQHRLLQKNPSPIPVLRLRDFLHYARRGAPAGFIELLGLGVLGVLGVGLLAIANAAIISAGIAAASLVVALAVLGGSVALVASALGMVAMIWNAMLTRAELSERLGDAVAIGDAWRDARPIRRHTFFAYLVFLPVATLLFAIGSAACGVGLLPTWVVVKLAGMHLRWQLYERRVAKGGAALACKAPVVLPSERHLLPKAPAIGSVP
jgi:hypothetical protein